MTFTFETLKQHAVAFAVALGVSGLALAASLS